MRRNVSDISLWNATIALTIRFQWLKKKPRLACFIVATTKSCLGSWITMGTTISSLTGRSTSRRIGENDGSR